MSADHKRPLYAFVIVAVLCALIIGNQLRSEAADIRKAIEAGAARVIPGMALHHVQQVHPTEPPLLQSTEPAAPRTTEAAAPTAPPAPAAMPSSPEPVSGATGHAQPAGQGATGPSVTHSVTHTVKHSAGSVIVHQEARQLVHTIARAAHVARPPVSGLVHQVRRQLARPGAGVRPGHGHGLALGLLRGRHEAPGHLQSHHRGDARGHHGHAHGHGPR